MKSGSEPDDLAGAALMADLERFKPEGISLNGWAVGAGVNRAVWGDIRRHGNPSRRTLEKLLTFVGSSLAEFEALRVGASIGSNAAPVTSSGLAEPGAAWRPGLHHGLNVHPTSPAGWFDAPPMAIPLFELASTPDSVPFALQVSVSNMEPRFRLGRAIVVDPRPACRAGDDVLVGLWAGEGAMSAKRFCLAHLSDRGGDELAMRQYCPHVEFAFSQNMIASIHRILGEAF